MFKGWPIAELFAWGASELARFRDELPVTAVSSLLFGVVIGGTYNWLRTRQFRSERQTIASEMSQIHRSSLRIVEQIIKSFISGDSDAYRQLKPSLSAQRAHLQEFFFSYAPYFDVRQSRLFAMYRSKFNDAVHRLVFQKISSEMATGGHFNLEYLAPWLFDDDNFGPLLTPDLDRFELLDRLFADFVRSIGVKRRSVKKMRSGDVATSADKGLRDLYAKLKGLAKPDQTPAIGALARTDPDFSIADPNWPGSNAAPN
jgi:hypothetical protein